ncbi:Initiator Replication protein [Pseudobutyrivibrio sp. ACV-2]|uniref:replication initiation protein n=1 Tax=Pseudobutyrivibrio sp. ACV-2 TaxID=1520801 RepID=UPI00089CA66A|nr:replication initiation protein [Pseudobutyrivibrio sp. ACV-2]SEB04491.1 Initiator Replication protein [Pseudobutyrivibrio sp. ACV-2]
MDSSFELQTQSVRVPNQIIEAKRRTSIIEEQIMWLSMAHLDDAYYKKVVSTATGVENKMLVLDLKVKEFAELAGKDVDSYYRKIKKAVPGAAKRQMAIKKVENGHASYKYQQFFDNIVYNDGDASITVTFAVGIQDYIFSMASGFTPLALRVLFKFTKPWSSRLYENLRSHCYEKKYGHNRNKDGKYIIRYSYSDLKLTLGIIDPEDKAVQSILQERDPDFEEAEDKATDVKYTDWTDFKRHVLVPSINEINAGTDIFVTYDTVTAGRRTSTVIFSVELIQPDEDILKNQGKISEEEANEMAAALMFELKESNINFTFKETLQIVNIADGDLAKIQRNVELLKKAIERDTIIDSYYGWLATAIRKDYATTGKGGIDLAEDTFDEQLNEISSEEYYESLDNEVSQSDSEKAALIMETCFDKDILLSPGEEDEILEYCQERDIEISLIIDAINTITDGSIINKKTDLIKVILSYAADHKANNDSDEVIELDPEQERTLAAKCKKIFTAETDGLVKLKYSECITIINDIVARDGNPDFEAEFNRLAKDVNEYIEGGNSIFNILAFIRSDIRRPYEGKTIKGKAKKQEPKNGFHNFSQRDYDMDALSKKLLNR